MLPSAQKPTTTTAGDVLSMDGDTLRIVHQITVCIASFEIFKSPLLIHQLGANVDGRYSNSALLMDEVLC